MEPDAADLPIPEYMTPGSAGADLRAAVKDPVTLVPGDWAMISTGLRLEIPKGYEGQIRPRSGLAARHGVTCLNAPGTIDSDFRGVVQVILINHGAVPFVVRRGDRIAQLVIAPVVQAEFERAEKLNDTHRGEGGFGHSGMG
ncbi:MAG: dUTP diphosphatase [Candidatus Sumerlaeaceae bacterium]